MIAVRRASIGSFFSLLLLCLNPAVAAIVSDLNHLEFDDDDRLYSNLLLYDGDNACTKKVEQTRFDYREKVPVSKELMKEFFNETPGHCATVCLEVGVHRDFVSSPLPKHKNKSGANFQRYVEDNCQRVEAGFLSYHNNVLDIYWVDHNGERTKTGVLHRGEKKTIWQQTYLGHRFVLVDSVTGEVVHEMVAQHNSITPIGTLDSALQVREVTAQVQRTFDQEWRRAHTVTRTFTEFGFDKGRLPDDLWASISAYYYINRHNKVLEEWDGKGLFVNWWEANVYFIPMPWQLKTYWQSRLKDLVQQWIGGVELELTDIYGMRRYEEGARLLTHVDREQTHATSLIINVAQGAFRNPWKVEIYDFADRLHEIEMEPGDIVYYESARCLHGRMRPLEGEYYVNLFAHYRPMGDPKWYLKSNPPGTPEQRIDIGTCTTNGTAASCSGAHIPHLSASLEQLHGAADLFNYWQKVAPSTNKNDEL